MCAYIRMALETSNFQATRKRPQLRCQNKDLILSAPHDVLPDVSELLYAHRLYEEVDSAMCHSPQHHGCLAVRRHHCRQQPESDDARRSMQLGISRVAVTAILQEAVGSH